MVNELSIFFIGLSAVLSLGVPVTCLIYFRRKRKIFWKPVLFGILVFVVMVLILEGLLNSYILQLNPVTSNWFSDHPYMFAVYGGLAAGVFEEGGRFLAYSYLLKKYREWKDGLAYGIGHGGIEAVIIGTLGSVQTLVFALLINSGDFETLLGTGNGAISGLKDQLVNTSSFVFALSGFERIFAFVLQIALSLLVLYAVRHKRMIFLLYAVLIHTGVNFVAGLSQAFGLNIFLVEGFLCIVAILALVFIIKSKTWFSQSRT